MTSMPPPVGDEGGGSSSDTPNVAVGPPGPSGSAEQAPPNPTPPPSQQQHPPPSPLSGCYLLVVLPEPHTAQHKDLILNRLAKGFLSWDKDSCHVDLEKELQALVAQAPEGEEARNGERLIQYATENLVTEVLIYPQSNTLLQCIRNLLASFTKHRHIIHAGYTFGGNGSWILQDGTFSLADFLDAFSEHEVQRVLRAYENSVTVDIHCAGVGDWSTPRLSKEACTKACRVRVNPDDVLTAGVPAITNFTNYIGQYLVAQTLDQLMEPSDVVGNIRFSHPTLYVFPGGQGDAALFGINGFNMLVDGGFARKACFWDFTRHLDRLDAVLVTRINNSNVGGMSSVLRKKKEMHVYPQIGHFFCNLVERRHSNSPDGDKDLDPLILDLIDMGQEMMINLRHINLRPHPCYRDPEPINLYHKVGHGTLDMYVLSPSKDSREVREFMAKWNASDSKLFASSHRKDSNSITFPIQNLVSICAMLVWQPANPEDTITRILFPGSTPQNKIFEGFERLRHLEFLKHPVCTAKSLSPSSSLVALKDKAAISKPKLGSIERETKRLAEIRREKKDVPEIKSTKKESIIDDNIGKIPSGKPSVPAPPKAETKARKVVENKKIESETKENKKIEKELRETKKEVKKTDKSEKLELETKKTDVAKIETEKTAPAKESKVQKIERKKESKESTKTIVKVGKLESTVKPPAKAIEKKPKPTTDKKDVTKSSPSTPKKSINGAATRTEISKTVVKTTTKATSKITSTLPAKSAKDANNRMVVEQKNIELSSMGSSTAAAAKASQKSKANERKPVGRRAKPMSPSKVRLPISPAKSTRSTPTASVKSEKDAVIRKVKGGTTDSSAVSTPSGIEPELANRLLDKNLTEKSEDMSLDSIESKVLADLKEEREVVEEIEAVLQKAERIEEARKEERFEGDDEITAEATDKKDEDLTEEDITAEMDDAPKKVLRKESQEFTEEDEYLIVEKEEIYTEDSVQSGDAEQKHHLDEVESEKAKINIEEKEQAEEEEPEQEEDKDFAEEKKDEVPEKQLVEASAEKEKKKSIELSSEQKEQIKEEVKQIIAMAMETVQKTTEEKDDSKKDSEDITKEPSSLSPEKLDSSTKPDVIDQKEAVPEKMEESQERISTLESGATTTAPTLPEDERIPLDDIKEDVDEKHVEEVKEKDVLVKQKEIVPESLPVISKPEVKDLSVKPAAQQGIARDIVKTPDEVADLPVHEEVDPKLYSTYDLERDKESKVLAPFQDVKETEAAPSKEQKGVFSFFGKVADKFEKGIDKLTKKARRDSDKESEDKSSKSSSPKELKPQDKVLFEEAAIDKTVAAETVEKELLEQIMAESSNIKDTVLEQTSTFLQQEIKEAIEEDVKQQIVESKDDLAEDIEEVEAFVEEASKKFKNVKDSLQDSLESLEEKANELKKGDIESKDIKATLADAAEKLVDSVDDLIESKEPEKVKFVIPSSEDADESEDDSNVIARDFKGAVRDVAEVLVGTAGIKIEKNVGEIVKQVADVLKEDDFLSKEVLFADDKEKEKLEIAVEESVSEKPIEIVTADKKIDKPSEICEEPCMKIVKEKDVSVVSPTLDLKTDKEDALRICEELLGGDIIKPHIEIEADTKVDVMDSGLEEICVKETAKREIDEQLGETVIVESEISFEQKLSPGKAELVTVTPGSTPTSPKLATEIKLPELSSDYKNILNKDISLDEIIEELVVKNKYKITVNVLEYITIIKNVPNEKIINTIEEIIIKYKIPLEEVTDDIKIFNISSYEQLKTQITKEDIVVDESSEVIPESTESSVKTDDKAVDLDRKLSKNIEETLTDKDFGILTQEAGHDLEATDISEIDTKEKYLDEAKEKVSDINVPEKSDTVEESVTLQEKVLLLDKEKSNLDDKLEISPEKVTKETINNELSKTLDSLHSGDVSPAESVFSKSPTTKEQTAHFVDNRDSGSKSPIDEKYIPEKSFVDNDQSDKTIKGEKSKSPSAEKELAIQETSIEKMDASEKADEVSSSAEKHDRSRSLSVEKDAIQKEKTPETSSTTEKDKSRSPSHEKEVGEKQPSPEKSILTTSLIDDSIDVTEKEIDTRASSVDKDLSKKELTPDKSTSSDKFESELLETEKEKDAKSRSPSAEKDISTKEPTPDKLSVSDAKIDEDSTVKEKKEKSRSPSAEKDLNKKEPTPDKSASSDKVEDELLDAEKDTKSRSPSAEKDSSKKEPTPDKSIETEAKIDIDSAETEKDKKSRSPSTEQDTTKKETTPDTLIDADTKIDKDTMEKEKDEKSRSSSIEKDASKKEPTPDKSIATEGGTEVELSETTKDKESRPPSEEKDTSKKESTPDKSIDVDAKIDADISEKEKDEKSKSPSSEKDASKKEPTPDKSIAADDKSNIGLLESEKDKSRSPSAEKDASQKEPSPEKSIDTEAKINVDSKETEKDEKSRSPSIEKDASKKEPSPDKLSDVDVKIDEHLKESEKDEKSRSPSTEKDDSKKDPTPDKSIDVDIKIDDNILGKEKDEKSRSPSSEKDSCKKESTPDKVEDELLETEKDEKSRSPSVGKESTPDTAVGIQDEVDIALSEIKKDDKSRSPSVEKNLDAKSRSLSAEKDIKKETTPEQSIESDSKVEQALTSTENEQKSRSPSAEKDVVDKEASPEKLIVSDIKKQETLVAADKEEKSRSPSVEKDTIKKDPSPAKSIGSEIVTEEASIITTEKEDKSRDSSVEKDICTKEPSQGEVAGSDMTIDEISTVISKSRSSSAEKEASVKEASPEKSTSSEIKMEEASIVEEEKSKSPSVEKDTVEELVRKSVSSEVMETSNLIEQDTSRQPSIEKDIKKESSPEIFSSSEIKLEEITSTTDSNKKSRSPSADKDVVKTDTLPDQSLASDAKSVEISTKIDIDKKSRSPSVEKDVDENNVKSRSASAEKDLGKKELSPKKSSDSNITISDAEILKVDVVKSRSPSAEKDSSQKDAVDEKSGISETEVKEDFLITETHVKSRSPSAEKDTSTKEPSPDKSIGPIETEKGKSRSPSADKEPITDKSISSDVKIEDTLSNNDKSRSPSAEKDENKKEPTPDKSASSDKVEDELLDAEKEKKSRSPSAEKDSSKKEATPEKSIETETNIDIDSAETEKDKKSRSPSTEKDTSKKESTPERSTNVDIQIDTDSGSKEKKSRSPSEEKDRSEKEPSPDKSSASDTIIKDSLVETDGKKSRSLSAEKELTPEKSIGSDVKTDDALSGSEKDVKSRSPSAEKDASQKEPTPDKSIIENILLEPKMEEKSRSPSVDKDACKKESSTEKIIGSDVKVEEVNNESKKDADVRSPSVEKETTKKEPTPDKSTSSDVQIEGSLTETEKVEKSRSPSVEKDISKKESTPDKSIEAQIEIDVQFSEKEKDEKSRSPSAEKDASKKEPSPDKSIDTDIKSNILLSKEEKDEKSRSPSVEKDLSNKHTSPEISVSSDIKVKEPISITEKEDKSRSPSAEKDLSKKDPSPEKLVISDHKIEKVADTDQKSRSPSAEKDTIEKEPSPEISVSSCKVETDLSSAVIDKKSRSPSSEKDQSCKEMSPEISVVADVKIEKNLFETITQSQKETSPEKCIVFDKVEETLCTIGIGDKTRSPSAEKESSVKELSPEKSIGTEKSRSPSEEKDKSQKEATPEKPVESIDKIKETVVATEKDQKLKASSSEKELLSQKETSPEKTIGTDKLDEALVTAEQDVKSRSPSAEKDDKSRSVSIEKDISKIEPSPEKSITSDKIDESLIATTERKISVSSIDSLMEDKSKDRSRSHSLFDSGDRSPLVKSRAASLYDDIITEKSEILEQMKDFSEDTRHSEFMGSTIEEKEEVLSLDEELEDNFEKDISQEKRKIIEEIILNEYVNKKRIVTLHVINELSKTYKIDRYVVIKIVNEIVANLKTNREAIIDFDEKDYEDSAQKMIDDQEKLTIYINDEFILKKRKISSVTVDEIAHAKSVSRHLVIQVIENIITSQNLRRESIIDDFSSSSDFLEKEVERKLSGLFTQDAQHYESKSSEIAHSDYESPFHKAFVEGMTEIRTTHITTLSGKSTPDSGLTDVPDSILKSISTTTTITNVPEKLEETFVEQSTEKRKLSTSESLKETKDQIQDTTHTENITITKTTVITTTGQEIKGITKESQKTDVTFTTAPTEEKISTEEQLISFGSSATQDIQAPSDEKSETIQSKNLMDDVILEQLEQSASPLVKDLITDVKSDAQKSSEIAIQKDIASSTGSTGKSTPDISMSPLIRDGSIMQSHLSGRSTPDKRSENRSRTATPEGFRSGDVIRTIITTTRTMSDDGEIITTTQEVTEATNDKGETVVLTEKTDVKVDERLPESFISDIKPTDLQRASTPSSDVADKEVDPTSPRSDMSSGHSRAATHMWGSSEERHTYSDEEQPSSPFSPSPHQSDPRQVRKEEQTKAPDDFAGATMTSSFYGELPSESEHFTSSMSKVSGTLSEQEDFSFKKFTVEKEYAGGLSDSRKGSKKYVDDADLDFDKALEASGFSQELSKSEQSKSSKSDDKEDPLAGWGSPLGLPSPKTPRKFNLRSPIQPCSSADLSPDSLNFDVINDWGEPMTLPSPAPATNEVSNKGSPGTPKKDKKQARKVMSENLKNKKRSESPGKNEKRMKDSKNKVQPVYVDLTYVSHHGNSFYTALEFFKKVRARYYVFSGTEPSREVYDALLEAKKTWEDKDLEVTMIPTYDTESLGYWVADNEEALAANHIDLSPSASRCTINLQDHETSCSAYRLEF